MRRRTALALLLLCPPALAQITQQALAPREAFEASRSGQLVLIDIRTPAEWRDTGIPQGAIRLDAEGAGFEVRLAGLRLDHPGRQIALIDRTGGYAAALRQKLAARGWRNLVSVSGGMLGSDGWLAQKLPVEPP